LFQHTLEKRVACRGVGLHGGTDVSLAIHPAAPDHGVVFARRDLGPGSEIRVSPAAIAASRYATMLASGTASVGTVEHLLAAAYALGLDNLRIELDGPEVPDLDGCASAFCELLAGGGRREQAAPRPVLRLARAVELRDGERWIRAEPAPSLDLGVAIDFAHPAIGAQSYELGELTPESFAREVAPARTFGFLADLPALKQQGLARGGDLSRVLILDERELLTPGGLRFPNEYARHKLLDLVGDLALLGRTLAASVRASRGGHALHHALVRAIAADGAFGE
jgi:UDP-3-O-[3-hydroxymyristoyl] N-acetylglucosamine deacetylase